LAPEMTRYPDFYASLHLTFVELFRPPLKSFLTTPTLCDRDKYTPVLWQIVTLHRKLLFLS